MTVVPGGRESLARWSTDLGGLRGERRHAVRDEFRQVVRSDLCRQVNSRCMAQGIGPAVAFHDAAIQPEKHATVDPSRVDPHLEAAK